MNREKYQIRIDVIEYYDVAANWHFSYMCFVSQSLLQHNLQGFDLYSSSKNIYFRSMTIINIIECWMVRHVQFLCQSVFQWIRNQSRTLTENAFHGEKKILIRCHQFQKYKSICFAPYHSHLFRFSIIEFDNYLLLPFFIHNFDTSCNNNNNNNNNISELSVKMINDLTNAEYWLRN